MSDFDDTKHHVLSGCISLFGMQRVCLCTLFGRRLALCLRWDSIQHEVLGTFAWFAALCLVSSFFCLPFSTIAVILYHRMIELGPVGFLRVSRAFFKHVFHPAVYAHLSVLVLGLLAVLGSLFNGGMRVDCLATK